MTPAAGKRLNPTALVIMAKAPRPGLAKTRLIPALGAQGAAALAEQLLRHAAAQAVVAQLAAVELCVSPDPDEPVFLELSRHGGITLSRQTEGDLGQRMHAAFLTRLQEHSRVLMIGTDAPAITGADLQAAAEALDEAPAVFMPAQDGGYALIGLREVAPSCLFSDMPWSTDAVMRITRQRLRSLGWQWRELRTVADIDEPADLVHLPTGFSLEHPLAGPPARPNRRAIQTTTQSDRY